MIYTKHGETKGTIFCIHGNSSSSKVFDCLKDDSNIKQSLVTFDLPGHGDNQNYNELEDFSFDSYKKELVTALNNIEDDILLIGNSLGGHLAIEIAPLLPNLKGLVIMGTPPVKKPLNFSEAWLPVEALNTFFTENPKNEDVEKAINVAVVNESKRGTIIKDFKKANPQVRKAIAIDVTENRLEDEYKIFTTIDIPKYIIAGDLDPSVNRDYLELVKNNSARNCKIIDIDNCGHYPSVDASKQFNKVILDISKEVLA